MRQHKALLFFPTFDFLIFIFFEALFFVLFYYRFNIHIFDETTLEQWGIISLWEFTLFTLITIGPFYFLNFIFGFFSKLAITHYIMHLTRDHKPHIMQSMRFSLNHIKELVQYAWLKTLITFTTEAGLKRFLHNQIRHLGAGRIAPESAIDYWYAETVLIIPCIGFQNMNLKKAIACSTELMEKNFGKNITIQFRFTQISMLLSVIIGLGAERIITYYTNQALGIAIFFAIVGFIFSFARAAEGIFQTNVYLFCIDKKTYLFTKSDLVTAFQPDTYNHEIHRRHH